MYVVIVIIIGPCCMMHAMRAALTETNWQAGRSAGAVRSCVAAAAASLARSLAPKAREKEEGRALREETLFPCLLPPQGTKIMPFSCLCVIKIVPLRRPRHWRLPTVPPRERVCGWQIEPRTVFHSVLLKLREGEKLTTYKHERQAGWRTVELTGQNPAAWRIVKT